MNDVLRLQRDAKHQVGVLRAGIGDDLAEEGQREGVGHLDVLRGLQGEVGHGEARRPAVVEGGGEGDGTGRGSPIYGRKLKRDIYLDVTAVGALAVLVHSVIAREVGVPLDRGGTEVVADVGLEDVVRAVGIVFKVAVLRV